MAKLSISIPDDLVAEIHKARGQVPLSAWLATAATQRLVLDTAPPPASPPTEAEIEAARARMKAMKTTPWPEVKKKRAKADAKPKATPAVLGTMTGTIHMGTDSAKAHVKPIPKAGK